MSEKKYVLTAEEIKYKLQRIALEIAEAIAGDEAPVVLLGVLSSGTVIAQKIASALKNYIPNQVEVVTITLDKNHPAEVTIDGNVDFNDKNIVIVDDVSNRGKTLLYAMKPLLNYHPKRIQTMVLVERMHKLFPVKPDYVGLSLATTSQDFIQVETVGDEVTGAYIQM
ncbi:phosphoribosyltransferase family protein [Danxiaibacter flavus]|uniref:Phosphoribosyltransferase family protein n=1 Tax=Danxiaibacter flavus TaxID=3049108 RepID=A0ABV3Z8P0_9BACT|nr:phosphoribosyltransferase family protein [Chitinophagaceae bacterium DXS]